MIYFADKAAFRGVRNVKNTKTTTSAMVMVYFFSNEDVFKEVVFEDDFIEVAFTGLRSLALFYSFLFIRTENRLHDQFLSRIYGIHFGNKLALIHYIDAVAHTQKLG